MPDFSPRLPLYLSELVTPHIVRGKMRLKKNKKTLQSLKEIGEEFGGKSSIHGLSYVCDPLLPSCERLLWASPALFLLVDRHSSGLLR